MSEAWYWCWITEAEEREQPDWSKVPAERVATVKARWEASAQQIRRRWKLWGPQIVFFARHYTVEVGEVCANPQDRSER